MEWKHGNVNSERKRNDVTFLNFLMVDSYEISGVFRLHWIYLKERSNSSVLL